MKYEAERNEERERKEAKLINKHVLLSPHAHAQINGNKNGEMTVMKREKGRERMEDEYKQGW